MKKVLMASFLTLLSILFLSACKNSIIDSSDDINIENDRVAVLYFSCTGNTEDIAFKIAEIYEIRAIKIIPLDPYDAKDLDYTISDSRANLEQNDPLARPAIANQIDLANYDLIYLGYPIWWGKLPKIIYTLLESYDFNDKTIIPYATSGGSGISTSVNEIKALVPEANVLDGRRFSANTNIDIIREWIYDIDIK